MPPRRRPIGEIDPDARYICDCTRYCKGKLSSVDERMFNRHAQYRTTPEHVLTAYYNSHPDALGQPLPANMTRMPVGGGTAPNPRPGPSHSGAPHGAQANPTSGRAPQPQPPQDIEPPPRVSPGPQPPPFAGPPPGGSAQSNTMFDVPGRPPTPPRPHGEPRPEDEDVEEGYTETQGVPLEGHLEDVRVAEYFIRGLSHAQLRLSGLDDEMLDRMTHPRRELPTITPAQRAAMRMFLARGDASEDNYSDNRAAIMELHPEDDIPSYSQVKQLVGSYTGVDAVRTDMCINSCVAFTGAFAHLRLCPECGENRYDPWKELRGQKVARRTFCTFPIGPQLQALYGSAESARLMRYRATRTDTIREQIRTRGAASITHFDDILFANDYLDLVNSSTIKNDDIVLMFSLDGAQLYQNKGSDCWFYVWVVFDLPPSHRYKKQYVLPGGVIGGPKKPKNIDSFLYPGFYHLSALQRQGLQIWDAAGRRQFRSDPYLYLSTADSPGMAFLNGLVGHNGKCGCRIYCGQFGSSGNSPPAISH